MTGFIRNVGRTGRRPDARARQVCTTLTGAMPIMALLVSALLLDTPLVRPAHAHPEGLLETSLLACPTGDVPAGGWPMIVLLHGYGVNKEDFDQLAAFCAERGVAALAVDGPDELGGGRRQWGSATNIERTHTLVQANLAPFRDDQRYRSDRVMVGGFSQGGIHSLMLSLSYPDAYGGILSIAPAPTPNFPQTWPAGDAPRPLFLVCGDADSARIRDTAETAKSLWEKKKHPVRIHRHPGGHHFPSDWPEVFDDALRWLASSR